MATSSLTLECLVSPTPRVSRRPVTMPSTSRSFSSGLLRPVTRLAASRSFTTRAHDPFYDVFGATKVSHPENQKSGHMVLTDLAEILGHRMKDKCTDDALHLRLFMPGVGKEDVKVWVDNIKSELIAEGKREKDFEDVNDDITLKFRINLPLHHLKVDAITAEMKDGVLKVCIPREMKDGVLKAGIPR